MGQIITSDIYLVSALVSLGNEIKLPIDANDNRHYRFTIMGTNLEELKAEWMNGTLEGNLVEFARCIKNVKLMLHDRNENVGVDLNARNK
jgi:hypothetical protein